MSKLIPNTFQNPNAYVDEYMAFLTPNEYKVLSYAIRRIIGFDKTEDRISIGQFSGGLVKKDGTRLDWGTGLSEPAVRTAIEGLVRYGLMVVTKPHSAQENLPPAFGLQWDSEKVDQAGLIARLEEKQKKDKDKAHHLHVPPPVNPIDQVTPIDRVNPIDPPRSMPLTGPGQWDSTHNIPVETQGNPVKSSNDDAPPETPTPIPVNPPAEPPTPSKPKPALKPDPPPLTAGQTFTLEAFGRTRYGNNIQRETIRELERTHGTDRLKEAITWAAKKGMGLGEAIPAVEKALPTWGQSKPPPSHHKNGHFNGSHSHAPTKEALPAWTPEEFDAWQASEGK